MNPISGYRTVIDVTQDVPGRGHFGWVRWRRHWWRVRDVTTDTKSVCPKKVERFERHEGGRCPGNVYDNNGVGFYVS